MPLSDLEALFLTGNETDATLQRAIVRKVLAVESETTAKLIGEINAAMGGYSSLVQMTAISVQYHRARQAWLQGDREERSAREALLGQVEEAIHEFLADHPSPPMISLTKGE